MITGPDDEEFIRACDAQQVCYSNDKFGKACDETLSSDVHEGELVPSDTKLSSDHESSTLSDDKVSND